MSRLANGLFRIAKGWAKFRNRELAVHFEQHSFDVRFVKPESTTDRVWDSSLYSSGNVHIGEYVNPVKVPIPDRDETLPKHEGMAADGGLAEDPVQVGLVTSDAHNWAMKMNVIPQMFDTGGFTQKMLYLLLAAVGLGALGFLVEVAILAS